MLLSRLNKMNVRIFGCIILIGFFILMLRTRGPSVTLNLPFQDNEPVDKVELGHLIKVHEYFEKRRGLHLSKLGEVLYLNEILPPVRPKNFKILIWKIGVFMEQRHLYYFNEKRHDPFEDCSVSNCHFTYEDSDLNNADAVVFLLHRLKETGYDIPDPNAPRPAGQRWVFITDESPWNTFMFQGPNTWPNYDGVFNWSMTFRSEADVPVPYGRTLPLDMEIEIKDDHNFNEKFRRLVPFAELKQRNVLVAVMLSNCGSPNGRMKYVEEMQKYMTIDVYGGCGTKLRDVCPQMGYGQDCDILRNYLFYLAFGNSNCNEYMDEKLWTHSYQKGNIPITMGAKKNITSVFVPPNSFIDVTDFATPEDLVKYIIHINNTFEENYMRFQEWRKNFYVVYEHGYMGNPSYHYCRLCEALNYNDEKPKVYNKQLLAHLLDPYINCEDKQW